MHDSPDILKLRILLCFCSNRLDACNVTGIARVLREEKYTVSRAFSAMEKEGLINRANVRRPALTQKGSSLAKKYAMRIEAMQNHLMYAGVDMDTAGRDAMHLALYCSDQAMAALCAADARRSVKHKLSGRSAFNGAFLCKMLPNDRYELSFMLYAEGENSAAFVSCWNEAFEQPCVLTVQDGVGTLMLRSLDAGFMPEWTARRSHSKVRGIQYFDNGVFVSAEKNGGLFSLPMNALQFVSVGSGLGRILHGCLELKIEATDADGALRDEKIMLVVLL